MIKQTKNGLFKLTGLNFTDLEAIHALVSHTRLGKGVYEYSVFKMLEAFNEFQASEIGYALTPEECTLGVAFEEDNPTITITSKYD